MDKLLKELPEEFKNPLFIPFGEYAKDEDFAGRHRMFVLCSNDSYKKFNFDEFMGKEIVSKAEFLSYGEKLSLIEVMTRASRNTKHRLVTVNVMSEFLNVFNHEDIEFEEKELVMIRPEMTVSMAKQHFTLYEGHVSLDQLLETKLMAEYFGTLGHSYITAENMHEKHMIAEISKHWVYPHNCKLNMSSYHLVRRFNYKQFLKEKAKLSSVSSRYKNIETIMKDFNKENKIPDYLQFMFRREFVDASLSANKDGCKIYRIPRESDIQLSNEQIKGWFKIVSSEREKFDLLNNLLLSVEYCAQMLTDPDLLDISLSVMKKAPELYRYVLGYSWVCLYVEECIKKTRTTMNDRYVFRINDAAKLPTYSYCCDDAHVNPYVSLLVSKEIINCPRSCMGIPMIKGHEYGVCNLDTFKRRLNLFTTGKSDKCIFDGINWTDVSISGSIIACCVPKKHPLITLVSKPGKNDDENFIEYVKEYYGPSDVDLMCFKENVFEYVDTAAEISDTIKKNLEELNPTEAKRIAKSVKMNVNKGFMIAVSRRYIEKYLPDFTLEDVICQLDNNVIREHFYKIYFLNKIEKNSYYRSIGKTNKEYEDSIFKISSIDDMNLVIITNDVLEERDSDYDNDVLIKENSIRLSLGLDKLEDGSSDLLRISENVKFKIESPYLKHSIEIFRIKFKDPFSCVARFHLPNVRGLYNGEDVYLLPSCITSMMTFSNIDYKYFAGIRDPIEIINKYRRRGYGFFLNDMEKIHTVRYTHET